MSEDASGPVKFFMRLLLKLGWTSWNHMYFK